MTKSKKLVFFGSERLATGVSTKTPTIRALIENDYEISAIVSHFSEGRSRYSRGLEIASIAQAHKIPLRLEALDKIKDEQYYQAEAAILVAYGQIIPPEIIDIFPRGIINIHPSLLPKYRGASPVEQTILDGAEQTGVSLMKLDAKLDDGPIFAQKTVNLRGNETKQQLVDKLLSLGADMLIEHLPAILTGDLEPKPQTQNKATYTQRIGKDDGLIDWRKSAIQIEREVRAYAGWPKSRATLLGHDVIVTKSRVAIDSSDGALVMQCNPGFLEILELKAPSGKTISGSDFMRGYSSGRAARVSN